MANNTNKQITIDVVADAKKFRDGLKGAARESVEFSKNSKNLQKVGIKEDKVLQKISKDFAKFNSKQGKEALNQEKLLAKELKKKSDILRTLYKQGKQNSAEFDKEQKALRETADLYSDIKKKRVQTVGLTKEEKSGGFSKGLKTVVAGGALGIAGLAVGAVKARITDALEAATDYNKAAIESLGDNTFDKEARSRARGAGRVAGFSATETMEGAGQIVRQTGQAEDVGIAQQLSRSAMIDLSRSIELMGQQARSGIKGAQAKKEQEKIIAAGFTAGMTRGRLGEFIQGVAGLSESAAGRTAGDVKASGYADILAAFGKSGKSGLQGARGASVLQQLEQGVMTPGAGEAGQSLILRSKGFGIPGQTTDYYSALKRQQQGFAGEKGADELKAFIDQLQVEYGKNSQAGVLAGSEVTGVSIDIMEKVMKVVNTFSGDSKELKKQIAELTKDSLPIEQQVKEILEDEVAAALKQQVEFSDTLVRQGTQLMPISLSIKDSINKLVTVMVDSMIPIFLQIRDFLKNLAGYFTGNQALETELKETLAKKEESLGPEGFKVYLKSYLDSIEESLQKEYEGEKSPDMIRSLINRRQILTDSLNQLPQNKIQPMDGSSQSLQSFSTNDQSASNLSRSVSNMSAQELEEAVARGTLRGNRNTPRATPQEAPIVNLPAPIVRTTVISPEPVQIQNR